MALIPARYVGHYPVHVGREHGPRHNDRNERVDGTRIQSGDIVMMPDTEVLGMTYWHDPQRIQPSLCLGAGHVVRPEDMLNEATGAPRTRLELQLLGYEFHDGRPDFEAVSEAVEPENAAPPAAPLIAEVFAEVPAGNKGKSNSSKRNAAPSVVETVDSSSTNSVDAAAAE